MKQIVEVIETSHTGFTVADVRATARLLCECFGFTATEPNRPSSSTLSKIVGLDGAEADIIHVDIPGHRIELIQYFAPKGGCSQRLMPNDVGFAHIAFLVTDVQEMARRAAELGFSVRNEFPRIATGRSAGKRATYIRDAGGFTIELMGR